MGISGRLLMAIVTAAAIFRAVGTAPVHQAHVMAEVVTFTYGGVQVAYTQQKP